MDMFRRKASLPPPPQDEKLTKLRKARDPLREMFVERRVAILQELEKERNDAFTIKLKVAQMEKVVEELTRLDWMVLDQMLDINTSDDEYREERRQIKEFDDRWISLTMKVAENHPQRPPSPSPSAHSACSHPETKRNFRLPKVEMKKFNGELTEWLSFWSQFQKIHEDESLHESDKFQYLCQAMESGTRAKDLIDSYPQSAQNYPKVINALKDRFGKPKLLRQVYVRELQQIVIQNAHKKESITLAKLYDRLESKIRALDTLGVSVDIMAEFLYPMVESCIPEDILVAWQRSPNFGRDGSQEVIPKTELNYLMEFLRQEVEGEEQRRLARSGYYSTTIQDDETTSSRVNNPQYKSSSKGVATATGFHVGKVHPCIFCSKNHPSHECFKAFEMKLEQKKLIIEEKRACSCCLRLNHFQRGCKSFVKCSGCGQRHFHLMCPDHPKNKELTETISVGSNQVNHSLVLLKTILVKIISDGVSQVLRVLFDDGSQTSYIRKEVVKNSGFKVLGSYNERNALFGGVYSEPQLRTVFEVPLRNLDGELKTTVALADTRVIAGNIPKVPHGTWMQQLSDKHIRINDYERKGNPTEQIDVLIGADLIPQLSTGKMIILDCGLQAVETIFGWTLMGPVPKVRSEKGHGMLISSLLVNESNVSELWELEFLGIRDPIESLTKKEKEEMAKKEFLQNISRSADGRYHVSLPWIGGVQKIPDNYNVAEKRLNNATNKLKNEGKFMIYDNIFKQWLEEGFIVEELEDKRQDCHYVPHRPVFKPTSKTTPVRPVFDASCKIGRNPSLNECLEKGPNLIELIPAIVLRFREGRIGIVSDIRKAFQMIEMSARDQDYLRFLWWEDESCKKIKIYKHVRVVFGVTCSPFILAAVIEHHLDSCSPEDTATAQKLKKSLYVDNCVSSVDTMKEYLQFKNDATRIMKDANMDLRLWEYGTIQLQQNKAEQPELSSVLGMKWNKEKDFLSCVIKPWEFTNLTKRILLSTVNQVFDPMGFLSPAMLKPKLILQEAWMHKLGWDEELPLEIQNEFLKWCKDIELLEDVVIPRHFKGTNPSDDIELHAFCDASKKAYATAIFARTIQKDGQVEVQLLQSKCRVAPLNKPTIPRLELLGAVIQARLAKMVIESLQSNVSIHYWTDSTTSLAWIQRNDEWGTFVGRRVKEICDLTKPEDWHHIPGVHNPADFPSRGCNPRELLESKWWEGPQWLRKPKTEWPVENFEVDEDIVNGEKKKLRTTSCHKNIPIITTDPWYASKFGSYSSNVRVMGWIQRFIINSKKRSSKNEKKLSSSEIGDAEKVIFRLIQKEVFPGHQDNIGGVQIHRNILTDGLIHTRTKITNREDFEYFRWPILLPHKHPIVDQMIREIHYQNGHAGIQFVLAKLRENVWILKSRKAVRSIIQTCVICRRFRAKPQTVSAAPLPHNRVKDARAFQVTGVDLAGPLFLKNRSKVWVVLFTCAVIRAIHLELVKSLGTETFMLALNRFISRRGRPSIIYSDNGTNFVGTDRLSKKINWAEVEKQSQTQRIQWIFNPPSAPWWGGFWERMIGTVKDLLRKMLGHGKLNYVQLETFLCQVEGIVNGRPLTYITEDPEDLSPLTPAMFIQDMENIDHPEVQSLKGEEFRTKYKNLLQLRQELRSRFRTEYLGKLVQCNKVKNHRKLNVGELVLVVKDNAKRLEWPMARIIAILPGSDGEGRVAKIKTQFGHILRPLQRLVPLEVTDHGKLPEDGTIQKISIGKETVMSPDSHDTGTTDIGKMVCDDPAKSPEELEEPKGTDKNVCEVNRPKTTRFGREIKKPHRLGYN